MEDDPRRAAPTLPETAEDLAAEVGGTIGRFTLESIVGAGGMGIVFAARDPVLDRRIALKVIRGRSPGAERRLLREAQGLARLTHPNVVTVHEAGVAGDSVFIAMELVDGVDLRTWLAAPHPPSEIVATFVAAGRGLAAAHAAGLVHRDFKPANVFVDRAGAVKVGDFGLVGGVGDDEAGALMGTPAYMAPEQARGDDVDARADQYAFCKSLDEALGGKRRPAWLAQAIARGLAADAGARHPSMTALCDRLEHTPARRRRIAIAAVAGVALAGALVAAWRLPARGGARVSCARAGDGAAAVWTPALRAQLSSSFAAVVPFGADTATRAVAAADAWTGRWRDVRIDACRATHDRGEQSAAVLDRRMGCLDRELTLAGTVLGRLAAGGPRAVAGAFDAISTLPSPEACDPARVQAATPLPDDPRVAVIEADLAAIRVANVAGDLAEARRLVTAARPIADALDHPGLRAEVLLMYAFYFDGVEPKAAQAAREQALAAATAAGDRDLEATATMRLLEGAITRVDPKACETLLPIARAAVNREGVPAALRLDFLQDESTALLRIGRYDEAQGACDRLSAAEPPPHDRGALCQCALDVDGDRYEAAVDHCRAAIAAGEQTYGAAHPVITGRLADLSIALGRLGRIDEANALIQRAATIEEAAYGADSLEVARMISIAAGQLIKAGRLAEAETAAARALAIYEHAEAGAPPSRLHGHAEQQLADALLRQDKMDDGMRHADRALAIFEASLPADHPDLIGIYAMYGNNNAAASRWPASEHAFARCAELAQRLSGDQHPLRKLCLLGMAQAMSGQGHYAEAVPIVRQGLAAMIAQHAAPLNLGVAHSILGDALGNSGDRAGARAEYDLAIEIFEHLPDGANDGGNLAKVREARAHVR